MVIRYLLEWSEKSNNDLIFIYNYILNKSKSKSQALKVIDGIRNAAKSASVLPTKHRIEPNFNDKSVRFTVKWSYKIIFKIKNNKINIVTVFHTSQNPEKVAQ